MLPEFISVGRLRLFAVILLTLACAAPFAVIKVRSEFRAPQTRQVPAGQPLLIVYDNQHSLAVSRAPVGVSTEVINLLLQAARLPALAANESPAREAFAYCNALSRLEERTPCYTATFDRTVAACTGYRLPLRTERNPSHLQPLTGLHHAFDRWPDSNVPPNVVGGEGGRSFHIVRQAEPEELVAGRTPSP